jgi:hypothetical protein
MYDKIKLTDGTLLCVGERATPMSNEFVTRIADAPGSRQGYRITLSDGGCIEISATSVLWTYSSK